MTTPSPNFPFAADSQVLETVTRELIAQVEPAEVEFVGELFAEQRALSGPGARPKMPRDDALGFGLEQLVAPLTPLAMAMVTTLGGWLVARFSATTGGVVEEWMKEQTRGILRGDKPAEVKFTPEQLQAVRAQLVGLRTSFEVEPAKAELLADALLGRLAAPPKP